MLSCLLGTTWTAAHRAPTTTSQFSKRILPRLLPLPSRKIRSLAPFLSVKSRCKTVHRAKLPYWVLYERSTQCEPAAKRNLRIAYGYILYINLDLSFECCHIKICSRKRHDFIQTPFMFRDLFAVHFAREQCGDRSLSKFLDAETTLPRTFPNATVLSLSVKSHL